MLDSMVDLVVSWGSQRCSKCGQLNQDAVKEGRQGGFFSSSATGVFHHWACPVVPWTTVCSLAGQQKARIRDAFERALHEAQFWWVALVVSRPAPEPVVSCGITTGSPVGSPTVVKPSLSSGMTSPV